MYVIIDICLASRNAIGAWYVTVHPGFSHNSTFKIYFRYTNNYVHVKLAYVKDTSNTNVKTTKIPN
jgi:hypothetical protein